MAKSDSHRPALALGDYWGNRYPKWIKWVICLKHALSNKLIKKGEGSYKEGKYDTQAILDALSKGPQSVSDDMVIFHTDNNSTTHDVLGWNEPVDYSPLYSVSGMNGGYMPTKMLFDNLTNFAGNGVEDPRADKILPWAYDENPRPGVPADVKWSGNWRRSRGVDMTSGDS